MQSQSHGAIAAFGYRRQVNTSVSAFVRSIEKAMTSADPRPALVQWDGDDVAVIDHVGIRVAIGFREAGIKELCHHLVMAVGATPGATGTAVRRKTHVQRADHLVAWIEKVLPYDTILRAETPESVGQTLVRGFLDLLNHAEGMMSEGAPLSTVSVPRAGDMSTDANTPAEQPAMSCEKARKAKRNRYDPSGIIAPEEVNEALMQSSQFIDNQAEPTTPLRLTVHTVALSLMLYSAPLGAFMFTYSMLRDMNKKDEIA